MARLDKDRLLLPILDDLEVALDLGLLLIRLLRARRLLVVGLQGLLLLERGEERRRHGDRLEVGKLGDEGGALLCE